MRDKLLNLLKVGVSLGLLLLLLWKIGWRETWETLRQADARYLLVAWGLYLFSMVLRGDRLPVRLDPGQGMGDSVSLGSVEIAAPFHCETIEAATERVEYEETDE